MGLSNRAKQNLDQQLVRHIEESERNGGILLKDLQDPMEMVIEIHARNSIYIIAIVDIPNRVGRAVKIAMQGGDCFQEPVICYVMGSTFGGSILEPKWIRVGMCLEVTMGDPIQFFRTSLIRTIKVKRDVQLADSIRAKIAK